MRSTTRSGYTCSLLAGLTVLLAGLLHPTPAISGQGTGPYGYTWIDSDEPGAPTRGWISWDNNATRIDPGGTDQTQNIVLPWAFPYYGQAFNMLRVSTNGFATFDMASGVEATNKPIPLDLTPDNVLAYLWDDLVTNTIQWTTVDGGDGFQIQSWGSIRLPGGGTSSFNVLLTLWFDGSFRYYYQGGLDNGSTTVGIESPGGIFGIQNLYNGVPIQDPGRPSLIEAGYEILYAPPILPDCSAAEPIGCGSVSSSTAAVEPLPPSDIYGCSADTLQAWEKVFEFTLTETSRVSASLTDLGGRDLRLYLLSPCNAAHCIMGDAATLDFGILAAGTYWIVVDGPSAADNGTFTLNVDCTSVSQPVQCGDVIFGDTAAGPATMDGYACAPGGMDFSGSESLFDLTVPVDGHIVAAVRNNPQVDVFILPGGGLDPATCLAWGDDAASIFNATAGDYLIVVDGPPGSEGAFDLEVTCGTQMDCSTPEPTPLTCGTDIIGADIPPGPTSAVKYSCNEDAWLGPEHVYSLTTPALQDVVVRLRTPDDMGVFLLNGCDEGNCLGGNEVGACVRSVGAGSYDLVVDSKTANGGTYDLQVTCNPLDLFQRWTLCEDARDSTLPTDTVRQRWEFYDAYYCIDDERHRNNFGGIYNGCFFAMYAVVECGTEMHLPLWDVEAGRLRIYDVLNEQYVWLFGQTPLWSQDGLELNWMDVGCGDADPNNDGFDPRFNEVVNDIHFYGTPLGSPVCGVFRMEFYDWGGFVWDLFSNCSGGSFDPNREVHFDIYDNICDALSAFDPKPELSILNVSDDQGCPHITLDFDMSNTGCSRAEEFDIVIYEELEGGGDNHLITIPVSGILPGEVIHFQETLDLSSSSSPNVRIEVDGNDVVLECSEAAAVGEATACRPQQGQHTFTFPICDQCAAIPVASANPSLLCAGGPTQLSGAGSTVATCAVGVPIEYNWTATPVQPPLGDPGWGTSPTMDIAQVNVDTTWYLWVRCQNDPDCVSETPDDVTVIAHTPPDMGTATATDPDYCSPDIRLEWTEATYYHDPADGPGVYNIFRTPSTGDFNADCAAALLSPAIATGLGGTSYLDVTTTPNETYVYVVQAEDARPANPCLPRGPTQGGATDGACVGPIWDEVDESPPDPDVGNTLFALDGDQDSAIFEWTDPRGGDPRQFFRVSRSETAVGSFQIVGDMIDTTTFTDPDAPAILYYYDVRTVDTCENPAVDPFPPDEPPPPSCASLNVACGGALESTTSTCSSDFDAHDCFARDATGPDRLHSLRLTSTMAEVRVQVVSLADLDIYVYDAAVDNCLDWGDDEVTLFNADPGRYWIVVDGATGERGDYTLDIICP